VIPGDIGAQLSAAIADAICAGELPPACADAAAAGTWRPPPGSGPGSYATSLPFSLARSAGQDPAVVAGRLAARLRAVGWITAAAQAGGYLAVTVTATALAALAVRVVEAGCGCARSDALAGTTVAVPADDGLAAAATWDQARLGVDAAATGRLAGMAGATIHTERLPAHAPAPSGQSAWVAAAVAYAGPDVIRYALARRRAGRAGVVDATAAAAACLTNPCFQVRYAHADAASTLRWAAGLGLDRGPPGEFRPDELGEPAERALLSALSWMPERVASAARRRRPDHFARYLEWLAQRWLDCRECCPALPPGGRAAPRERAGIAARLWLAVAAQVALGTGLRLLGVQPQERL
jgi:arginyl-tRNA synthetase